MIVLNIKLREISLTDKKNSIKIIFLLQIFVILAVMTYFSIGSLDIVDEKYNPIVGQKVLTILLIISGLVGIVSMYLFNEIVKLLDKEKEYELQKIEIIQMKEANDLLKSQKHDFSNNLQVIWGMLSLGNLEKAKEYLDKYTNMLKIDDEELDEIKNISDTYLYTLFLNKCHKCKDMEIDIHYSIDPGISIDDFNPIDIIRIFGNLLDNAIYAVKTLEKQYREILVDMYCDNNNYIFSVSNKGPQIPEHLKHKIFEKEFTTKGNEGSGMGLYNVSGLVNKYKGKIWLEQNSYLGTQFIIRIPKRYK